MLNALFVITGRSRLQWASPTLQGQLDYTGPASWPRPRALLPAPAVPHTRGSLPGAVPALAGRSWSVTSPRRTATTTLPVALKPTASLSSPLPSVR